jgi:serine phosphatase RsbU (regulator of sigma subunit)/anti-sigma regulatory factor (Ser/Thr protein kinase)
LLSGQRSSADRGSWSWTVRVAELTAWGTAAVLLLILHFTALPTSTYRAGLALVGFVVAWIIVTFRVLLPRARRVEVLARVSLLIGLAFAGVAYGLLRAYVPSVQLTFVPVIVVVGLVSSLVGGLGAAALATIEYLIVADLTGALPSPTVGALNGAIFSLAGSVAGVLAGELRLHYSGEQHEHRLATAVRQRLLAVLDAVGEAIVFRDRRGLVRIINERAEELFEVEADDYLGRPAVELLRTVARQTEDPEGFMESFQELRERPRDELRIAVEQIIPRRRQLRLVSRPTFDEAGVLVGRIDVYTDVTESVARAAEVERLLQDARRTAESYQRALLPAGLPALPRINLVAHYIPAAGRRAVCGDFYDFVALADGHHAIVLGDVCGVGPAAANDAALTRYTLRSFASGKEDLPTLVANLNEHIARQVPPERFVRILIGALDPERASLQYVNAGHVPPVVFRSRTGRVEWLLDAGIVLGVDEEARYSVARVDLEPGDMLVFYTDGVTEASRQGRPLGQGKLSDLVTEYGVGTPGELVQAVRRAVEAWSGGGELRDDVALIACQVVPDTTLHEPTRELVIPNEPARIQEVREFVAAFLVDVRAAVEAGQEMLLAVGEAVANACRHGRRGQGRSELRVRCVLDGDDVVVTVSDDGGGFDVAAAESGAPQDRFASGGRGLFLMRAFVDSAEIASSSEGTTVTLRRKVCLPSHTSH